MEELFFTLSGFNDTVSQRAVIFSLASACYCLILLLNLTVVAAVASDAALREPMYVLLCAFCINGLYGATGFYPKFLSDLLRGSRLVPLSGCLLQAFVLYSFVCSETSILALMAYDRYLAICMPLQYHAIMTRSRLYVLVGAAWLTPSCLLAINIVLTAQLSFCGADIQRVLCLNWVVVRLACPTLDTLVNNAFALATLSFYILHWLFIVWTYVYMVRTCARSEADRSKFMHTCLPHLISLLVLFISTVSDLMNMRFPAVGVSAGFHNFSSIAVVFFPPLMNPLLYGFRLTKVRNRIALLLVLRNKSPA